MNGFLYQGSFWGGVGHGVLSCGYIWAYCSTFWALSHAKRV
ncbi:hypothetical protein [Moraxella bovoculi]|nr:hypothetical protein [Moraxella bovoculi]